MSAVADRAGGEVTVSGRAWSIAIVVALATFMEVLDTTIANVALRYISGGLAVGPDEAAWVVTSYLVANAVALTGSSFLARRYGRKLFFLTSIAIFTTASIACGFATNLDALLFFRVIQGIGGGGMAPIAQSILADAFPPQKRGQAFALYGIALVVAPVIGPTLGGWLSDNWSWHWCFLINGPIGVMALGLMLWLLEDSEQAVAERHRLRDQGVRFDVVGFLLVATFLGALEVVLDEGQRDDWFGSSFILTFTIIMAVAFLAAIPWLLGRENPAVDIRLFKGRHFTACFLVMLATGAMLIATTQFVPQIVQEQYGYTATLAGLALLPGGLMTVAMMVVSGKVSGFIQPRWLIMAGGLLMTFSMYDLTYLYSDSTYWFFATARIIFGAGIPLVFISITAASYEGLKPSQTDQASGLINMARNVGGSMGVCLAQNVLAYRGQFHQSRLVEHVDPSNPAYQQVLDAASGFFATHGRAGVDAQNQAIAWIGQQLQTQSTFWAYIDVYWSLGLVAASIVPLAFILHRVKLGGPRHVGH